jgi:hypothetical protein
VTEAPLKPRRPQHPPTTADLAERDRFAQLAEKSLPSVQAAAEAWRNGLAAFVTLVTTGAVVKGRDMTDHLTSGWRVAVTVLIGGGVALSLVGLWHALAAQAGTSEGRVTLAEIHRRHASVAAYQVALAATAATRLRRARAIMAASLACLLLGVASTWWAPTSDASPPTYLTVDHDGTTTCGTLLSADRGSVRLQVLEATAPVVISFERIANLHAVTQCP